MKKIQSMHAGLAQERKNILFVAPHNCTCRRGLVKGIAPLLCTSKKECNKCDPKCFSVFLIGPS